MLAPDQVIPFFTDERCFVRRQALRYFSDGAYPLGSLNADHLWNVIEHFSAHTCDCLRLIGDVPQTENSFQSLMRAMGERPSELVDFHLQRAAGEIDFDLVVAHRDELLHDSRLLPHVRQHHEQRLKLATQPTDVLWNQLMEHGQEVHACHAGEFDWRISGRLIEALVRRADMQLLDRAIGVLRDAAIRDTWNEVFLVMLLGRARCESAIDLLLEKLLVPDADVLNEESFRALGRIGTIEVVEKAAAAYPGAEWSSRLFVREPIHRIKLPRSESALMQLVEIEEDFELNQFLLSNLCDLGSMQGLQRVRDRVASNCNDPETRDLCASMLATAVMNGVELPEAKQWRRIAERDEAQLRKLIWQMNDGFASAMRDNWRRTGCNSDPVAVEDLPDDDSLSERDYDFDFSLDRFGDEAPMVNAETFRRDSPKIGRNDPCPCGSGKKYKKCCGG